MRLGSFDALVKALDDAHVRYLVAGGLAVNAHGLLRFTKDVDLVIQLLPDNIERAFTALGGLGYRPIVPVQASQLADRATREGWVRDKGMQVLQFWSDAHPETPVDVFVAEPFEFDEEHGRALMAAGNPDPAGIDWALTTWEGARREQMRRWAELPLERIVLALEEMEELAHRLHP